MKRTRSVQIGERSRKASLPTSDEIAPGGDPHHPAESQPHLALDATDDKIIPKLNRKEERAGSALAKNTTNNRPEPEHFDDIIPRQPPVAFEDRMVSIAKLVDATTELLRSLRWFCRKLFRNSIGGPTLSPAEQKYAAYIPAFHRAHTLLFRDHLVAIRVPVLI